MRAKTSSRFLIAVVVFIACSSMCQSVSADPQANKVLIQDRWLDMMNTADLAAADEIFATGFTCHAPHYPQANDLPGYKVEVVSVAAVVTDFQVVIEDLLAEGETVVGRFTASGKMPPAGIPYTNTWIIFFRFADGKIAEEWWQYDLLGVQQQLGMIEPARPGPEFYLWDAPSDITGDPGTVELNKLLALRIKSQFWNGKDIAGLDQTHHAAAIGHDPSIPGDRTYESYKQSCLAYQIAFPDFHVTIHSIVAEGDKVATLWTASGTQTGELLGVPASGKKVTFSGATIYRMADGKVAESWWSYDALGVMMQITTPPEYTPKGNWIVTVPSPMGDLTFLHAIYPLDETEGRYGGILWQVNPNPTFFGMFPDFTGGSQFWTTESVRTAPNTYTTGMVVYNTKPVEGLLDQVGSIGIATVTWTITGPDTNEGITLLATYLPDQDADKDGLPDAGQVPVACTPFTFTSKRAKIMPACVPPPTE